MFQTCEKNSLRVCPHKCSPTVTVIKVHITPIRTSSCLCGLPLLYCVSLHPASCQMPAKSFMPPLYFTPPLVFFNPTALSSTPRQQHLQRSSSVNPDPLSGAGLSRWAEPLPGFICLRRLNVKSRVGEPFSLLLKTNYRAAGVNVLNPFQTVVTHIHSEY